MTPRSANLIRLAATAIIAGLGTTASGQSTPPAGEPVRVSPGDGDLGPSSEVQWVDQRVNSIGSTDFSGLYETEDGFMRSLGALRAVFPRSVYVAPSGGVAVPIIPYDTIFMIGDPDNGRIAPIVPRPGMVMNRRISGLPTDPSRPFGAGDGSPFIDRGTSLIAPGDAQRPSAAAMANARRVRELAAAGTIAAPNLQGFRDEWAAEAGSSVAAPNAASAANAHRAESVIPRPERPTRPAIEMPAIVSDRAYRRARLTSILRRAAAATVDEDAASSSPAG